MVDGSNESLYHANEEFDPNLCTGVPLQKSLEIVDVGSLALKGLQGVLIKPPSKMGNFLKNL